ILTHGLFNGDPHPGNFMFQPDGRMVFLDFGFVQRYGAEDREAFGHLLRAVAGGAQGDGLWTTLEQTLLIPPGTSPEGRDAVLQSVAVLAEPLLASGPYRYTPEYTTRV